MVVLAALVALAGGIAGPPCRLGVATSGSTIPNIAEAPRIGTELLQTGLAARHVATLWRIARPVLANSLAGKAAICPATGREAVAA